MIGCQGHLGCSTSQVWASKSFMGRVSSLAPSRAPTFCRAGSLYSITASSVSVPEVSVPEEIPAHAAADWARCSERLQSLGIEPEKTLKKSFGWGAGKGYWRGAKVDEVPSLEQIEMVIAFLGDLGITAEADIAKTVTLFPEALGLPLDLMNGNVNKLKTKYSLKGNTLANAIKRKPKVLGSIIDCEGTCAGECTRCFAQF